MRLSISHFFIPEGSGIGKGIATRLAKLGGILVLWDVDKASNDQTAKEIVADGGKAFAFKCDLSDKEEIYRVAGEVLATLTQDTF
jgi:all-trans-retinol dehydrogenase (NAD+)